MKHKPFKTYEEQLDLLINEKGLIVTDKEAVITTLSELNYYRLSGYSLALRKNDHFYKGVTFEDLMQVYNFDKKLKLLLLGYLEDIEISLRSYIGYVLGSKDTDKNTSPSYLDPDNYCSAAAFEEMSKELKSAVSDNKNEAFVKHHNTKYGGVLATWAMVEVMSFGKMSKLLSSLNINMQKEICKTYYGKRYTIINNWMEGIVVLRNLCAHHARLINRGIVSKPDFTPSEDQYFVSQGYDKNEIGSKVFFRLIIIDRLSHRPGIHEEIKNGILNLSFEYPFVDLKHYGFKRNWTEIFDEINKDY